mmetsp:Transcript_12348/g.17919  ORF Transcript_12348/g.17919 Transcript_12348/m.17919 type:complete len:128 (-) Transcript_12348:27-410(-)
MSLFKPPKKQRIPVHKQAISSILKRPVASVHPPGGRRRRGVDVIPGACKTAASFPLGKALEATLEGQNLILQVGYIVGDARPLVRTPSGGQRSVLLQLHTGSKSGRTCKLEAESARCSPYTPSLQKS